ncbi:unnamed protein product, partial [Oikopleura dioica]
SENFMLDQDEKGRLTPFLRILVENALAENADFGRITPTIEELVKKTIEDGRASAQREIKGKKEKYARNFKKEENIINASRALSRALKPEKSESTAQDDNSNRSSSPESSASEEFDESFSRDASRAASRMTKDVLQKSQIEKEEIVEAGQSSEEASRAASRMRKEIVENESEEQVPKTTTESSEASRVASRMARNVLKNELTTAIVSGEALEEALLSANASRAVSRKSFQTLVKKIFLLIVDPAATEATVEIDSIAAQKSDIAFEQIESESSDARNAINPFISDIVTSSLQTGLESAEISRNVSRMGKPILIDAMKSAEQSRVASRMAENEIKRVTFEVEKQLENEKNEENEQKAGILANQALLNGLQSAENSRAESRMLAEQIYYPPLTPEVMKLVKEALDDGMLSRLSNYSEKDQPRMTPVVLKLVEDAMRGGLESPLPEAPFPKGLL